MPPTPNGTMSSLARPSSSSASLNTSGTAQQQNQQQQPKKEVILIRARKGLGVITDDDTREMQRACGYGGPHIPPKIQTVRLLCKRWGVQAVEARTKGAGLNTPLMTTIKYGHREVALELIDAKWDTYDVTVGEYVGEVFDKIMKRTHDEPERPDNRANIYARGVFRWTPLHYAAREAQSEVVKAILDRIPEVEDRKSYVNLPDKRQRTPLWLAIFNNAIDTECKELCTWYKHVNEVIQLLVENGADISKALSCKHSQKEFRERLFMEFQSATITNEKGEISKQPEKYFFRNLLSLAQTHKQCAAEDQLIQMLHDEENPGANKKGPRNKKG